MDRRTFLATGAATMGTALAGCLGRADVGYDVAMVSNGFVPASAIEVPDDAPDWVPPDVPTVEVRVGEPLVWENTGSRIHTVTAATRAHPHAQDMLGAGGHDGGDAASHAGGVPRLPDGATFFASGQFDDELTAVQSFIDELNGGGAIAPGERYAHSFHTPGWYHYYCIPHEPAGMAGNVYVRE
ncbi:Halocyanin [Halanaeroarchaeum sp. HSR-CO]|uniref:plastocyanin/azurin family copper-binding protein n=1 Tax=Halanaeroarchaeum sp. HSR-CO TaxID=2866382 RepID=UPI00217E4F7F|nr:plastocyanin/azurin family copper-binding protein [Halanaeroarchaeum sp. HSR-CO]UWG46829.1 Halocyanin [Halanaeroarchaeum sp. HSR-CO]